jgi:hypothetical protein
MKIIKIDFQNFGKTQILSNFLPIFFFLESKFEISLFTKELVKNRFLLISTLNFKNSKS